MIALEIQGDICPSCGGFVLEIDPKTGWCLDCTKEDQRERGIYVCVRCSSEFKSQTARPYCAVCRRLNWLEHHADEIEDYMFGGLSFEAAKEEVKVDNKPVCMGCGTPLPKDGFFCTKSDCRKLYKKFWRLKEKGLSEEAALREVI